MQLQQPFDYNTVEPSFGFPLVPADWYPVIVKDDLAENTDSGGRLVLWLEIINHPSFPQLAQFAGHRLRMQLNLYSKDQQNAAISWKQFSAICHAVRVPAPIQATEQLRNIPFAVRVSNDGQYNNVKEVKTIDGQLPGKAGPVAVGAAPPTFGAPAAPAAPVAAAPAWAPNPAAPPAAVPAAAAAPAPWGVQPAVPTAPAATAVQPPWGAAPAQPAAPTWPGSK